jgi:hypothetical protein
VDEQTGIWKEEGTATKTGTNYVGTVKHFTYWNCDVAGPTVNLTATFKNADGIPLVHAEIRIRPATGYSSAHGYTDSLGQINGPVPANTNLTLEVMSPCYTVMYSQNIGPFSSNVSLGTITVNNNSSLVTVQGRLLNCSGAAVTNGFAIIYYSNVTRYAGVNANGDFTSTFFTCAGMPATCEILGVDATAQQQGAITNVSVVSPVTNAGNINACGTSTLQFVNYNLDGTNHSISSLANTDGFTSMVLLDSNGTTSHGIYITGYHGNTQDIAFQFAADQAAGEWPMTFIRLQALSSTSLTLITPFTVTLTNYAAVAGEFHEGSFSGQFKDVSNVIHTISCSFRVRRS